MAGTERLICPGSALIEGGNGLRFSVLRDGKSVPAFAIRYDGCVYAYLNQCAHIPVELDWTEAEFFDSSGLYLICTTHGATYEPATGHCILGPCKGRQLTALGVYERDGSLYLTQSETAND